jgi:VWFA-related protein
MRRRMDTAQDALSSLFQYANADDEAFLLTFSSETTLRLDFTRELDQLGYRLLLEEIGGRTALVDAVFEGLKGMQHARNQRRAIVVISDAGGNLNARSNKELLREAVESDVRVYPVIVDFHARDRDQRRGKAFLDKLAHRTGGRTFVVKRNKDMAKTMETLGRLLHSHYVIGYYPRREAPDGKWQKVRVSLDVEHPRGNLRADAPGGYYRPSGKQ